MTLLTRTLALLCALLALGTPAFGKQTLVVGVEEQPFQPHFFVDAQGQYQGYARELLDAFAQSAGFDLIYKPMPVERLLPALIDGTIDLKYPDNADWGVAAKKAHTLAYSQPLVEYVDGVLVDPRRLGAGLPTLARLAVADGWSLPADYASRIDAKQMQRVPVDDLRRMISKALLRDVDGAYFNVVVATYYLDNIRVRPGALVFDPSLPYKRGTYSLSSIRHADVVLAMDRFLQQHRDQVDALKTRYGVEANLSGEFLGVEQWKVDYIKRQRAREAATPATP